MTQRMTKRTDLKEDLFDLRAIFENIQVGIHIYHLEDVKDDSTLRMVSANQAAVDYTGVSVKDIVGKTLDENFPGLREKGIPQIYAEVVRSGKSKVLEDVYYADDRVVEGAYSVKAFPLPNNCVGISFTNITERKRAENELRMSEERYRFLIENQTDLVSRFLPDGTFIFVNDVYCHFFNKTKEELLNNKWKPLPVDDDVEFIEKKLSTLSPINPMVIIENRVFSGKGEIHWMQFVNKGFFDDYGNLMEILSVGRDITNRKQIEKDLRKSENFLNRTGEMAKVGGWQLDLDSKKVIWTQTTSRIHELPDGYVPDLEEAINFYHPDDRETVTESINQALETGKSFDFETRLITANGRQRWVRALGQPIMKDEKCIQLLGTFQDITERKRADESLKKSELQKKAILDGISTNLAFVNEKLEIQWVNKTAAASVNKSPEEMMGHKCYEFWADPKKPCDNCPTIKAFKTRKTEQTITYTPNGQVWDEKGEPVFDEAGKLIGVLEIAHDITDKIKAEESLKASEERFRSLAENSSDWIWEFNEDNIFTYSSHGVEKIIGYTPEEVIGKSAFDFIPSPEKQKVFEEFSLLKEHQKPFSHLKNVNQHKDGHLVTIESSGSPIINSNGQFKGYRGIDRDASEREKAEEQLRHVQKMEAIGTLAGGIAHDFNNMLSVLTGNISYALSIIKNDEELYDVLSDMMQSTKQAQNLTHQLLTFAKGGKPIKTSCNINKLLGESPKFFTSGTKSKCNFNLADNLKTAKVDSGQINQVISNLVINADQAMPDGGIIFIRTENTEIETDNNLQLTEGSYVKISIEDQGIGIHEKHISNIFDPYFTTKQKGSGLGLATAYSIIKRHGGRINVYSEVGKGTVFNVYLPASSKEPIEVEDKAQSTHEGHGKILIMDDQEPILKMVSRMLGRMGYEIVTTLDGSEAVETYSEAYEAGDFFDMVILDLTVPGGMGGAKTVIELLKIDPEVKAVVSSGYSNDPIMSKYQDYGFCGVVPKPYTKAQLSEVLNRILGEKCE